MRIVISYEISVSNIHFKINNVYIILYKIRSPIMFLGFYLYVVIVNLYLQYYIKSTMLCENIQYYLKVDITNSILQIRKFSLRGDKWLAQFWSGCKWQNQDLNSNVFNSIACDLIVLFLYVSVRLHHWKHIWVLDSEIPYLKFYMNNG